MLALAERQARDDRSPLRPPDNHHADDHEGDDDDREQRDRHRRIVCSPLAECPVTVSAPEPRRPMTDYVVKPLDANTWDAFARLVERHNGVFGGR